MRRSGTTTAKATRTGTAIPESCVCAGSSTPTETARWETYSLTKGATEGEKHPKLQQARADFIASDTSTGLGESTRGEMDQGQDRFASIRNVDGVAIRSRTLV